MDDKNKFRASLSEEGRYRLLVEAVTDYAIYMLDPTGLVTSWNAGAQRFKGYTAQEIIGQHFSRFYPPEDRAAGRPALALAIALKEGRFEGEGWRLRKDGSRFWAHVVIDPIASPEGELFGFAKITRDLTERRAAESALRRTQEQFRLLVQGVTDYAIYMLDTEGHVNSWNAGAERIKGYTEAEILGRHFSQFYRDEDRALGQPAVTLATAARDGRCESEGWRVRKDGSHFWAHVIVDAIRDESRTVIGYAKVTRDVTAKREAQHELEQARESLFQSQKLDAIGQLTGGVAHDFNNLLMVIMSSLEIVRRRAGDDPKTATLLDNASKAAQRGASLTQRMLSFARRQDLKPTAVDALRLVHGMSDLLRRSLGPTVTVAFPAEATSLPPAIADANQLELALLNLTVNARDAMPHGGSITIAANEERVVNGMAGAVPASVPDGRYVRLSVTDNGEGMDAQTLSKATEPFFTTKGVGKGTGLGLSMVQGLAVQSGGQFILHSEPGQGTTAQLWLPVAEAEVQPVADAALPNVAVAPRALKVLVVDDDELVLANTVTLLEELGHLTLAASSSREALTILRSRSEVQVLLTDHAMPGMTGAELIDIVRHEFPKLRLILATGYAQFRSELPDAVHKLTKPFGFEELARAMEQARPVGR